MTLVLYEPEGPALEFIGHAGAGLYGQDPVCAALSMLLYTLIRAVPQARVHAGDGYCRVDCAPRPAPAPGGDAPEASGNSTRFDTAMRDVELSQSPPIRIPAQRIRIGKEKEGSIVQLSPTGGSGTVRASFDAERVSSGAPDKAQRSGFVGEKEKEGSIVQLSPTGGS